MATGAFKPVWRLNMAWTEQQANAYISGKSYDEVESMNGPSQPNIVETESVASNVEPATAETTTAEPQNETPVKEEENSTSPVMEENPEKVESIEQATPKKFLHTKKKSNILLRKKNAEIKTFKPNLMPKQKSWKH